MLNLDTHILVHAFRDQLKPNEKEVLSKDRWSISSIVFWEIAKLAQLGRIEFDLDDREVQQKLARLYVWPITLEICRQMTRLDFQGDPADELIAATSIVHSVPLVTRDRQIRGSQLVPFAT